MDKNVIINSVGDLTIVQRRYEACFHVLMSPINDRITDCLMSLNLLDYVSQIISLFFQITSLA